MKTKTQSVAGKGALARVQKHFPQVTKVQDATKPISIQVKKVDSRNGKKKDPTSCAMAKAACRELHADGAIINIGTSYVIKGNKAVRYRTPQSVAREIVSFDRHQDFAPGKDYNLTPFSPTLKLDYLASYKRPDTKKTGAKRRKPIIKNHRTSRIRLS